MLGNVAFYRPIGWCHVAPCFGCLKVLWSSWGSNPRPPPHGGAPWKGMGYQYPMNYFLVTICCQIYLSLIMFLFWARPGWGLAPSPQYQYTLPYDHSTYIGARISNGFFFMADNWLPPSCSTCHYHGAIANRSPFLAREVAIWSPMRPTPPWIRG
jgi:hypothetical protein